MFKNAITLFIITIVIVAVYLPSYSQMQDLRQKNADYHTRVEALIEENEQLKAEKKKLKEDPLYLEHIARDKMGVVREGEVIYKLVPVSPDERE